VNKHHLGLLHI